MTTFGIDFAWGRPGVPALRKIGAKFVARYLAYDNASTHGKILFGAEARTLSNAGIWIVVVWETSANRALAGKAAGAADAAAADAMARACGMPATRPIYFAVDWDANIGQQDEIHAYLDGAASVIGRTRVGLYAGYYVIKRAFDKHKITYGWQTYAWSGGNWDSRVHIQQYSNGHTLNGVGVDYDHAVKADYGQWRSGVTPTAQEDDLPYTQAQLTKIVKDAVKAVITDVVADAVWRTDSIPSPTGGKGNPTWMAQSVLTDIDQKVRTGNATMAGIADKLGAVIDPDALAAAVLASLTPEKIADAVVSAQPSDLAERVITALSERLATPPATA